MTPANNHAAPAVHPCITLKVRLVCGLNRKGVIKACTCTCSSSRSIPSNTRAPRRTLQLLRHTRHRQRNLAHCHSNAKETAMSIAPAKILTSVASQRFPALNRQPFASIGSYACPTVACRAGYDTRYRHRAHRNTGRFMAGKSALVCVCNCASKHSQTVIAAGERA